MAVRSWRTAFLTLRDETLISPPRASLLDLLRTLLFSQIEVLASAARALPPHEVTSDVMFIVELAANFPGGEDEFDACISICHLIHDISCRVLLELNSSSWAILLDFLEKMAHCFFCKADTHRLCFGNSARVKAMMEILEILRLSAHGLGRICSSSDSTLLIKLLLRIVSCSHAELFYSAYSSGNQRYSADIGTKLLKSDNLWEVQTTAFGMIGDAFSRIGSSVSVDIWQSTLEVLRKVMDVLASKSLLVEDYVMSRFYTSLLHCLHVVLSDPKGSLSEHVAGFVAALQMFFVYGLTNKSPLNNSNSGFKVKEFSSLSLRMRVEESVKSEHSPYKPPHLRKREGMSMHTLRAWDSKKLSDSEPSGLASMSSDSEHSDSDGSIKDVDCFRSSKARIAAITCIQDLCQADPKSLTAHWTMLLPTNDVLQPRKHQTTLMTCLLFDPILKTRMASASTIAAMLDGPSSVFLQVAEYKESTKCGSFTTLSISLGQMLMQLHKGILHLIQYETHSGLLASLFKVLVLLISATPYARMPGELLPAVISAVQMRMIKGFSTKADQTSLLAAALGCLGAALSTSPPSLQITGMLQEEVSKGLVGDRQKSCLPSTIFQLSQRETHPSISFEALQALRAALHNYPNVMTACWEHISTTVSGWLRVASIEAPTFEVQVRPWKSDVGNAIGSIEEKCIMAAIKVLDECLRATSGFRGMDDLLDDRLLDTPFISDCTKRKKISSAPLYGYDCPEVPKDDLRTYSSGGNQWCESIEKHLPLTLLHSSPMVRAASVTCFAGLTSSVFSVLTKEKQDFIISSAISAALNDVVPSVRSAACRAIGVIACFPQVSSSAEILDEFIHAAEINTHSALVSVRITASWALANICDSLRHRASDFHFAECSAGPQTSSGSVSLLAECALRLTKDGDKIKSNAVRALGNLSRFVRFTNHSTVHDEPMDCMIAYPKTDSIELLQSSSDSKDGHNPQISRRIPKLTSLEDFHWLERMVQAFVSCVTTGNVKVQWNVCHALSNLFLNETLTLLDMAWAPSVYSILLLLLRDSTNFKIRIHAAVALAVPTSRQDYGSSFSDVVQGLEHILETLGSDQISSPSSFKYMATLEKQLTATTLHVLGLASCNDPQPLKDFLVKKAPFLEEWFKSLCSSLLETRDQPGQESSSSYNQKDGSVSFTQKKVMISKALRSLIHIYEYSNHRILSWRFEKLVDSLP